MVNQAVLKYNISNKQNSDRLLKEISIYSLLEWRVSILRLALG